MTSSSSYIGAQNRRYGSVRHLALAGFGAMLTIVLALGVFSIYEMRHQMRAQDAIYEHPLVVSNAAMSANTSVVKIHRAMKDVVLLDAKHLERTLAMVARHEQAVQQQLKLVEAQVLGTRGKHMHALAAQLVLAWRPIRAEVIRLVRTHRTKDAAAITAGKGARHVERLHNALEGLATYARNRATEFYTDAQHRHERLVSGVIFVFLISGALAMAIAFFFSRRIATVEAGARMEHELLRAVIEGTDDLICARDEQSRILFANSAYERVVAHSQLLSPDMAMLLSAADRRVIQSGQSETVELVLPVGDRSKTYQTRESPLRDVHGAASGVVGISRDVTAQKLVEQQLRVSNRALAVLGGASHAAALALDEDDLLHDICRIAVEVGGYLFAWIGFVENDEGKTVRPVASMGCAPGYIDALDVTWADAPRGHGPTGKAVRTGEAVIARRIRTDVKFAPWRQAAINHGFESSMALPLIISGQPMGVLNVYSSEADAFDMDEARLLGELSRSLPSGIAALRVKVAHKNAEERLELLSMAVDQAEESIVITDAQGCIQYVNPAFEKASGYTRKEALGKNPRILKSGVQSSNFYARLWAVLARGDAWTGRLSNRKKDGSIYVEDATISPIVDSAGVLTHFIAVKKDITQQVAAETRTLQSQKLESIGQLSAGIAHEINTPIQFVSNNTTFLKRAFSGLTGAVTALADILAQTKSGELSTPEAVDKAEHVMRKAKIDYLLKQVPPALEQSLEGIDRVSKLVGAMKEFSHPSKGEMRLVELDKVIETTIAVARNEWKYVAEMELDFDPELPAVPCLRDEFNQLILNLIVNAAHTIADVTNNGEQGKGTITIQTRRVGDDAVIKVSDTGAGIAEENLARIFDPFYTTKDVGKGTGQGLAIARSVVVDKHGGELHAESEVGVGTTFIIRLPVHRSQPPSEGGAA